MWYYKTEIGTFYILRHENRYGLIINDEFLAAFDNPHSAAQAVKAGRTGYSGWDGKGNFHVPDLDAWRQLLPAPRN